MVIYEYLHSSAVYKNMEGSSVCSKPQYFTHEYIFFKVQVLQLHIIFKARFSCVHNLFITSFICRSYHTFRAFEHHV